VYACVGSIAYDGAAAALAIPDTFIHTTVHANDTEVADVAVGRIFRAFFELEEGKLISSSLIPLFLNLFSSSTNDFFEMEGSF
jgi:hypothetical protein